MNRLHAYAAMLIITLAAVYYIVKDTLIVGFLILITVWMMLVGFAEEIDDKSILQHRIDMARQELLDVKK